LSDRQYSTTAPKQRARACVCYLSHGDAAPDAGLVDSTIFPAVEGEAVYAALQGRMALSACKAAMPTPRRRLRSGLTPVRANASTNRRRDAETLRRQGRNNLDIGVICSTLARGLGALRTTTAMDALRQTPSSKQSAKHDYPQYIETHRATITQDMWRTVELTNRHPDVRFNGDFSHWYTGLEMPYGGMDMKLDFIEPIFDRVRFMHGRIGSSGAMQVDIGDGLDHTPYIHGNQNFLDDFRAMWTRSMRGFLQSAKPGDFLVFSPELIPSGAYYALMHPGPDGQLIEQGDRWQQALLYCDIARDCFTQAQQHSANDT
jgi:hypothetical protein